MQRTRRPAGESCDNAESAARGKNLAALSRSRDIRAQFKRDLGCVPTSILTFDRSQRSIDVSRDSGRQYKDTQTHVQGVPRALGAAFAHSNMSVRTGALSTFPQNIGTLVVKFYCDEGGLVYDPFAGHNSRMQLTYEAGRSYVGVDVSREFHEANCAIREMLIAKNKRALLKKSDAAITLYNQSSARVPQMYSNFADFTLTSPPYWNIEYYGDEEEQLGNAKTYDKFMQLITEHVRENFRILKPGAYCCWFINDFVIDGVFYPYHVDLFLAFESVGFVAHAVYIVDLGSSIEASFVQSFTRTKRFPKRHEYCLVFKKPED